MNFAKKPIRVCHITSVHPVTDLRIFSKECRSLAEAGYIVSLIIPKANCEKKDGVRIIGILPFIGGRFFRMTITVWRVLQAALKEHAQVYHFHDPELIPVGLILRFLGKKVIYDVHEDYPLAIQSRYWLPLWIRKPVSWLFERFEYFSAKYFNYIVSATPAIAKRFESINDNTVIVQNFPLLEDLSITENKIPWQDRLDAVVFIGAIDILRGIREMVEAIELVQRKSNAHLILAGNFSPESLKEEIQALPGWKKVEYRGFLSPKKQAELLKLVKAGLLFYHPLPHHQVSYPTKLFGYMAAGIPVILSDFVLWKEIVEGAGCGLVVDPLDPQAIADSIVYLLEHPKEAEAMGRRGIKAVEKRYNWSKEEEKLLRLYKDLLE